MTDYAADLPIIEAYNARRRSPASETMIQTHMGPELSAGDPPTAAIVLLMNNPGFDPATSDPTEHTLRFDGWPLAGLHPDAAQALQDWYKRPFGELIRRFGPQRVSQRCALVQLNPWASEAFDSSLILPSRRVQVGLAAAALKRGALVVAGRSHRIWREALADHPALVYASNVRNPSITPSGIGLQAFERALAALA